MLPLNVQENIALARPVGMYGSGLSGAVSWIPRAPFYQGLRQEK
jgi:hypothetical protein